MSNMFKNNLNLKLLSLICAVFLWIYVYFKENPSQEHGAVMSFVVPLTITGLSSDLVVVDKPDNVILKVSGNKDLISELSVINNHLKAYVDLSNKTAGEYRGLVVQASTLAGQVEEIEPKTVDIILDNLELRNFDVNIDFKNSLRKGYAIDKEKTVVIPPKVQVKGAYITVARADKVVIPLDISDAYLSFKRAETPIVLDKDGKIIDGVELKPAEVQISVEIVPDMRYKTVPIVPWIYGSVPEGYEVKEVLVQPVSTTIQASEKDLDSIESIRTGPIDITGKIEDVVLREVLILPDKGIEIISSSSVQVLVRIQKKAENTKTPAPKKNDKEKVKIEEN